MKKNLVYFSFLSAGVSLVISGCAPELARTNYGPEELRWKNYVQGCYNTWAPPPAPAPYSENSTSTSSISTMDTATPLSSTEETTIPVAAMDSELAFQPVVAEPSHDNTTATTVVTPESTLNTYTVQKGDSLWAISKKVYGDGKYWQKILNANKGKLSSPSSVREGMVLDIPAK